MAFSPISSLTYTTGLPSGVRVVGTKKGSPISTTATACIGSSNMRTGTMGIYNVTPQQQQDLNKRLGKSKAALIAHLKGDPTSYSQFWFDFGAQTVSFYQNGKKETRDLMKLYQNNPGLGAVIKKYEDLFYSIHPMPRRHYVPMGHTVGNQTGASPLQRSTQVLQSLHNVSMEESAQIALKWRQESPPADQGERRKMFRRMVRAQEFYSEIEKRIQEKMKDASVNAATKAHWQRILDEIHDVDKVALMAGAALMPHELTSEKVSRTASQLTSLFNQYYQHAHEEQQHPGRLGKIGKFLGTRGNGIPFDSRYATDVGAVMFSGLSADAFRGQLGGREAFMRYYEDHDSRAKQEGMTGLILRTAVEGQGLGLKAAYKSAPSGFNRIVSKSLKAAGKKANGIKRSAVNDADPLATQWQAIKSKL